MGGRLSPEGVPAHTWERMCDCRVELGSDFSGPESQDLEPHLLGRREQFSPGENLSRPPLTKHSVSQGFSITSEREVRPS